jgi:hypothetical protein
MGQRGCFSRDADGAVTGVDLAGRLFHRTDGPLNSRAPGRRRADAGGQ